MGAYYDYEWDRYAFDPNRTAVEVDKLAAALEREKGAPKGAPPASLTGQERQ